MDCYIGIDLGSTTTKAVYMDARDRIMGRGITNSRSNYELACEVAADEAAVNARMMVLSLRLGEAVADPRAVSQMKAALLEAFRRAQHLEQVEALEEACLRIVYTWPHEPDRAAAIDALQGLAAFMRSEAQGLFGPRRHARSDFFRDIASSQYTDYAERMSGQGPLSFEQLTGLFDKAILQVEGRRFSADPAPHLHAACAAVVERPQYQHHAEALRRAAAYAAGLELNVVNTIGTGYGRQTLPFPRHQLRSEILCHGLGAYSMFPRTRTVLDIGGQDTKAIQVDDHGIVTSFQMNDRCAAGCGRYLGYIADEMNMGLHQLGPMALGATRTVRINSTCTVFAGAELRERLALGERREDIVAGLHRAIILRAMSLLARSGGVHNELTFTGGVAKNPAATRDLENLVREHYGEIRINISPDSIYTGAIGAALFSRARHDDEVANVDIRKLRIRGGA